MIWAFNVCSVHILSNLSSTHVGWGGVGIVTFAVDATATTTGCFLLESTWEVARAAPSPNVLLQEECPNDPEIRWFIAECTRTCCEWIHGCVHGTLLSYKWVRKNNCFYHNALVFRLPRNCGKQVTQTEIKGGDEWTRNSKTRTRNEQFVPSHQTINFATRHLFKLMPISAAQATHRHDSSVVVALKVVLSPRCLILSEYGPQISPKRSAICFAELVLLTVVATLQQESIRMN